MSDPVVRNGRTFMLDQQGRTFSVPVADLDKELRAGSRPETPEEFAERQTRKAHETAGQQALTAAEGAGRGASFGLSEVAAASLLGDDYRKEALERKRINPGLSAAGEVGGAIAGAIATGGAGVGGLAERAALKLAPKGAGLLASAARGAIATGAAGAAEGAAYGFGTSAADAALEDREWTAESALSAMKHGALYGGLLGGAAGAAAPVVSKAGRRVLDSMLGEGKTLRQAVADFADKRLVTAAGGGESKLVRELTSNGATPERLERAAQSLREAGITGTEKAADATRKIETAMGEAAARRGRIATQLDAGGAVPAVDVEAFQAAAKRVEKLRAGKSPDHARAAELIAPHMAAPPTTFEQAAQMRSALDQARRSSLAPGDLAQHEVAQIHAEATRALDAAGDSVSPEVGKAWHAANEAADDLATVHGSLQSAPGKKPTGGLQTATLGAVLSLASGGTGIPALLTGLGASAARKLVESRGSAALGWVAERVAGVEYRAARAAEALGGEAAVSAAPRIASAASGRAAAPAFDELAASVRRFASNPSQMATAMAAQIEPIAGEQPEVAAAMLHRMVADHAYLASKLPAGPDPSSLITHSSPPLASRLDRQRFLRYASALDDPPGALENLAAGQINWEAADALRERRPLLWEGFRVRTLMTVAKQKEPLPYKRRAYLSVLFGTPLDPSLAPGAVPMPPTSQPTGPGASTDHVAMSKVSAEKIGQAVATPAQGAMA
jgi:hypothetical protein